MTLPVTLSVALQDLNLAHLWIIYPGIERYVLDEHITVVPARELPSLAEELKTSMRTA